MSFIFCPLYKYILNDDIKNRILIKIKEFQCHSEWNTFDLHINISDIEISSINIDDIIKQRNIWKNIAKLSIDLWRDFDYYKQYTLKSKCDDDDEYKKRLESLGCICEEGAWRSISQPSEEVVQTSVFMYCLYEMMVKEKIGYIGTVIDNKSIICIFCDSEIGYSEDNCNICSASKEEREDHQKNIDSGQNKQIHNKEDNDEGKINKNEEERDLIEKKKDCLVTLEDKSSQTAFIFKDVSLQTFCNVEDKSSQTLVNIINKDENLIKKVFEDGINEVKYNDNDKLKNERRSLLLRKADKTEEEINERNDTIKLKENSLETKVRIIENKWKCGRCEYLNEYTFINCEACEGLYKDGKWNCGKCTMENSCVNNKCEACGETNVNIIDTVVSVNDDDKFDSFKKENININAIDKVKNEQFDFVKKDLNEFEVYSKEIKENTSNDKWKCGKCEYMNEYPCDKCKVCGGLYEDGKWNCGSCTLENSCVNERCGACIEKNINLKNKKRVNDEIKDLTKNENDRNEFTINNKVIKDKTANDKWNCGKCEYLNEYPCDKCKVCGGLYKDGKWNCGSCTLENSCDRDKCRECRENKVYIKNEKRENDEKNDFTKNENEINNFRINTIEIKENTLNDKWKCGKCEYLNEYTFINCKVCEGLYKDGKWNRGNCTLENSCVNNKCKFCGENNVNSIKTESRCAEGRVNDDDKFDLLKKGDNIIKLKTDIEIDKDKWKCGRCGVLHLYNFTVCNVCGGSRIENGLWRCSKCTMLNKCEDKRCKACNTLNDLLKKFEEPSKSIINKAKDAIKKQFPKSDNKDNSEYWKCTNNNCKKENNIDSQYCEYCYLIKDHDLSRGAAIKWKQKDVESVIWICFKCLKFNKIEEIACKGKNCRYPRYEKK